MKKQFQGFVIGVIVTIILAIGFTTAFAESKSIEVFFNNIKISIDGKEIKTDVEPLIYGGRTYVPIRFIADNMGMDVKYNETTDTVELTSKNDTSNSNGDSSNGSSVNTNTNNPTIIKQGFYSSGATTIYVVKFSDGYNFTLSVNANSMNNYKVISMLIDPNSDIKTGEINKSISLVAFNTVMGQNYYPVSYSEYSMYMSDYSKQSYKTIDLFEQLKVNNKQRTSGLLFYKTYYDIDGINFDDDNGHKGTLWLKDENN